MKCSTDPLTVGVRIFTRRDCARMSYRELNIDLTFEKRFGRKACCVTPLASGLYSLPLVAPAAAEIYRGLWRFNHRIQLSL